MLKRIISIFFSMLSTGLLVLFTAFALGYATFIENKYGTSTARILVYNAYWFDILLGILAINIIGSIIVNKLFKKKKFAIFLFHLAFIFIIVGAAFTRYTGFEGTMHIHEKETSNILLTSNKYIQIQYVHGTALYTFKKKVLFSPYTNNHFKHEFNLDNENWSIGLNQFYPSMVQVLMEDALGVPYINVVVLDDDGSRKKYLIALDETINTGTVKIAFTNDDVTSGTLQITENNNQLFFRYNDTITQINFNNSTNTTCKPDSFYLLELKKFYRLNNKSIAVSQYLPKAQKKIATVPENSYHDGKEAIVLHVVSDNTDKDIQVIESQNGIPNSTFIKNEQNVFKITYGRIIRIIPFSIYLKDFQLTRYPGSNSPSSFNSFVSIIDGEKSFDAEIFMNNTLKYKGFRFFQTSYDKNEKGTILTVTHDPIGTSISYLGYFIMILGFILALFSPASRFRKFVKASAELASNRKTMRVVATLLLICIPAVRTMAISDSLKVDKAHAIEFGSLLIQNKEGRIEPVNTHTSEALRKIYGKSCFEGMNPVQWYLSVIMDPEKWMDVPMIKISDKKLRELLSVESDYMSFKDAYDLENGKYKIGRFVEQAYNKEPTERKHFDKEVIKLDERLNVFFMMINWNFLTIFPMKNDQKWVDLNTLLKSADSTYRKFGSVTMLKYHNSLLSAMRNNDYTSTDSLLKSLQENQVNFGANQYPSDFKVSLELTYINSNVFKNLSLGYLFTGLVLLIIQLVLIIKTSVYSKRLSHSVLWLLFVLFIIHSIALAVRWYITGHAPWSNGYEAMIFVSWSACLAGIIFSRWSDMTLAVSALLSALTLLVAGMSWMNPQLTNLVPVLKSIWLIIHVAVVTSSYGFLGISAMLGITNLLLTIFQTTDNADKINHQQLELSYIIQIANIVGLFLLASGSVLGGVWANESWGRYWGWDPKETWALITILVYAFLTHMHKIKGFNNIFILSTISVFAYSSVLMTYFGVNYYLSGLHSYGQGENTSSPAGIYVSVSLLLAIVVLAAISRYKLGTKTGKNDEIPDSTTV